MKLISKNRLHFILVVVYYIHKQSKTERKQMTDAELINSYDLSLIGKKFKQRQDKHTVFTIVDVTESTIKSLTNPDKQTVTRAYVLESICQGQVITASLPNSAIVLGVQRHGWIK